MVVSTAGRSFWILDDLSALQQSVGKLEGLSIFSSKPTYKFEGFAPSWMDIPPGTGQNPDAGVILTYYLPEAPDTLEAKLQILDLDGNVIRTYSSKKNTTFKAFPGGPPAPKVLPAVKGLNRFAWDFKSETLTEIPNAFVYGDYTGYKLAPGKYKTRITCKDKTSEADIEIVQDPNLKEVKPVDWSDQQAFMKSIESRITDVHNSVNNMRKVKKQIMQYNEIIKDNNNIRNFMMRENH